MWFNFHSKSRRIPMKTKIDWPYLFMIFVCLALATACAMVFPNAFDQAFKIGE